jgi:hypothetical protein
MGMGERATDVDTSDNPVEDTERMARATSFHTMALDTQANSAMDIGENSLLPKTIAAAIDPTLLY